MTQTTSNEDEQIDNKIRRYVVALATSGDNFRTADEPQVMDDKTITEYVKSLKALIADCKAEARKEWQKERKLGKKRRLQADANAARKIPPTKTANDYLREHEIKMADSGNEAERC